MCAIRFVKQTHKRSAGNFRWVYPLHTMLSVDVVRQTLGYHFLIQFPPMSTYLTAFLLVHLMLVPLLQRAVYFGVPGEHAAVNVHGPRD